MPFFLGSHEPIDCSRSKGLLRSAEGASTLWPIGHQAGAPIKTEYLDRLGRVIATGVEGFDGKEIITKIDYNARGAKIAEHEPVSTGGAPGAWNVSFASPYMSQFSGIDVLGRATTKTIVRSSVAGLFVAGKGSA